MNRPLVFHTFHKLVSSLWVFWVIVQHKTIIEYTEECLKRKDFNKGSINVPLQAKGRMGRQKLNNQPLFYAGPLSRHIALIWNHLTE